MSAPSGKAPRVIGRYALYDPIASGGMATVHIGRLLGSVGFARTVAIKRLHPHLAADPDIVAMLVDEARLVSRIRHPNVVPTLDVVSEQGELFLVMEYVQGEALSRLIRSPANETGRIPPEIVATILVGVLHGLQAAHDARDERGELLGIVHRDVSPQNILVGVDGVPRLVDFGVAKAASRVGQATRDGQIKGKLAYMAPEQVRGITDRRTDIFAASVVLWESLTGVRLFTGATELEILAKVMEGVKTPPSSRVPGLPAIFDAVTMRGLSPDPAKRYQSAREMARELEDAMPLVAPSKVGEWVEGAAATVLAERAGRIDAIESSSATNAPVAADIEQLRQSSSPDMATALAPSSPSVRAHRPIADESPSTQLSSVSGADGARVSSTSRPRRRSLVIAFGVGLTATTVIGAGLLLSNRTPSSLGDDTAPARSAIAPSPPPAPPAPTVAPTTESVSATVPSAATATASAAPASLSAPPASSVAVSNGTKPAPRIRATHPAPEPAAKAAAAKVKPKDDTYDHM